MNTTSLHWKVSIRPRLMQLMHNNVSFSKASGTKHWGTVFFVWKQAQFEQNPFVSPQCKTRRHTQGVNALWAHPLFVPQIPRFSKTFPEMLLAGKSWKMPKHIYQHLMPSNSWYCVEKSEKNQPQKTQPMSQIPRISLKHAQFDILRNSKEPRRKTDLN